MTADAYRTETNSVSAASGRRPPPPQEQVQPCVPRAARRRRSVHVLRRRTWASCSAAPLPSLLTKPPKALASPLPALTAERGQPQAAVSIQPDKTPEASHKVLAQDAFSINVNYSVCPSYNIFTTSLDPDFPLQSWRVRTALRCVACSAASTRASGCVEEETQGCKWIGEGGPSPQF